MTFAVPLRGDKVTLSYDNESSGIVVAPGPEVSEVQFDDKVTRCIPNGQLRPTKL